MAGGQQVWAITIAIVIIIVAITIKELTDSNITKYLKLPLENDIYLLFYEYLFQLICK